MIFTDESIQQELGYICAAFVHCVDSPEDAIKKSLLNAGLTPGVHEYKSGARMIGAPHLHALRESFAEIIRSHCKIAIYLAPVAERPHLLENIVRTAQLIIEGNDLSSPQDLFVDEGVLGRVPKAAALTIHAACDSKHVLGIQLADYAAYHCSYMLKQQITGLGKKVIVESMPHPAHNEEVDLEWLIRSDLRRSFFLENRHPDQIVGDDWFFKLDGYGAFFSQDLPAPLAASARATFESMYMGCII